MKSIFNGAVYTKIYSVGLKNCFISIKDQEIMARRKLSGEDLYTRNETHRFDEYEKFYEYDVNKPPFAVGDNIYIDELDITTEIRNVTRSVNDYFIYDTNKVIRINDNNEAKLKVEKELQKTIEEYNQSTISKKKWYEFWK